MTKKAALYARVSTQDKGQDPEMQLYHLRNYVKNRGFEVYKEYVDHGISGTKDNRPALNELMNDAHKKHFDLVLVWRFDRFGRSLPHLVRALEEFNHLGIDFISYSENIDTSSPMGKAMFAIIGAFAQYQRDVIVDNVKGGLERARANGKKLGRPKTKVTLEQIQKIRAQGLSIRKTAKKLKIAKATVEKILGQAAVSQKTYLDSEQKN